MDVLQRPKRHPTTLCWANALLSVSIFHYASFRMFSHTEPSRLASHSRIPSRQGSSFRRTERGPFLSFRSSLVEACLVSVVLDSWTSSQGEVPMPGVNAKVNVDDDYDDDPGLKHIFQIMRKKTDVFRSMTKDNVITTKNHNPAVVAQLRTQGLFNPFIPHSSIAHTSGQGC